MLQYADEIRTTRPIPVTVHALDPLSRAGVVSYLRQCPEISLVEDGQQARAGVALLIADTFDATVLTSLSRLVRTERTRVVLVLDRIQESELLNVVSRGVTTILWRREVTKDRLRHAVLTAERGHGELPPDLLGKLIGCMGRRQGGEGPQESAPVAYGMVPREVEVLRLVAEGLDTGEIAVKLLYSERTIKNILHTVTSRFQLRNRAHAVAYALREGYL
ncbi:response regulator transcription factor [Kitasatospora sp. NPDC002227]|uniref:helix-turn-helix transcriptional regulator n=1 Tax=Kitasatospora sp. NPDC002227 TaxID=3154773 RepID=UPI00332A64C6